MKTAKSISNISGNVQRKEHRTISLYMATKFMWALIRGVIIMGICFVILYPTLVKISVSFMDEKDLYDLTVRYVPKHFTLENMKMVWEAMDYPKTLFNSFRLSALTSLLQLASCTIIGYGFARFKFKGRGFLFTMLIITMIIPPQTLMIPLFLHFRFFDIFGIISKLTGSKGVNLLDSYWPFALMSATGMGLKNGLYIYIIRQFFRGMPKELEEAAYIDGANLFKTFYRIMLPSAIPAMLTVFLFSFVWQWTDTFYSGLFLQNLRVLPVTLNTLADTIARVYYWESSVIVNLSPVASSMYTNAGTLLVVLPLIIIYLATQRHFVESIERSGIVG